MNPTQNQDDHEREARTSDGGVAAQLAGLLTSGGRFRGHIASALSRITHPAIPQETAEIGYAITDVGRATLDVSGQDDVLAAEVGVSWCARHVGDTGYVVTDSGLRALAEADAVEAPGSAPQVLRSAALYLERYGWIQHAYYDPTATVFTPAADLVGAVAMVCYGGPCEAPAQHFGDPGFLDFEEAVLHLDRFLLVEDGSESYEFNDAPGRTAEDVVRVLRDAAARPARELIDALQALDSYGSPVRDQARLLTPKISLNGHACRCCPACGSGDRYLRIEDDGFGPCSHYWHDGDSDGGDA